MPRAVLCLICMWTALISGQLLLYMPREETHRLVGIDAEVLYLLNNSTMRHALNAQVVLNASYNQHVLYWRNLNARKQIEYTVELLPDHPDGLEMPIKLNITSSGVIPNQLTAMSMTFNCTGSRIAVRIGVRFNLTNWQDRSPTSITLNRKKICVSAPTTPDSYRDPSGYTVLDDRNRLATTGSVGYTAGNPPKPTSTEIFYVAVGVASGVIILVAVIIFTLYIRTRRQTLMSNERPSVIGSSNHGSSFLRLDGNKNSSLMSLPSTRRGTLSSFSQPPPTQEIQITLNSLAINRKSVTLGDIVLEGAFGRMMEGVVYVQDESEECYEQKVLIKSVSEAACDDQIRCMLIEGSILKGLNHQYINPLIAACLDETPLLIYPFSDKGNLKLLLKASSSRISQHFPCLNTQKLVCMAVQVARGLHYLHRKHIIHRDVAVRNCCADSNFNVKVTDYALSRDLFPDDYSSLGDGENKPVKWMAVECLAEQKYSYATDTWSFGVLLWELITFAQQPYCDVNPSEMNSYLQSGYRLLQPSSCPDELFAVMAYCWAMHPSDRPSLTQILACLQEFHQTLSCFI